MNFMILPLKKKIKDWIKIIKIKLKINKLKINQINSKINNKSKYKKDWNNLRIILI